MGRHSEKGKKEQRKRRKKRKKEKKKSILTKGNTECNAPLDYFSTSSCATVSSVSGIKPLSKTTSPVAHQPAYATQQAAYAATQQPADAATPQTAYGSTQQPPYGSTQQTPYTATQSTYTETPSIYSATQQPTYATTQQPIDDSTQQTYTPTQPTYGDTQASQAHITGQAQTYAPTAQAYPGTIQAGYGANTQGHAAAPEQTAHEQTYSDMSAQPDDQPKSILKRSSSTPATDMPDEKKMKGGVSKGSRYLLIASLVHGTKAIDIRMMLSQHGKVQNCKIGASKGHRDSGLFALVTMETPEDAAAVMEELNNSVYKGYKIEIKKLKNLPGAK